MAEININKLKRSFFFRNLFKILFPIMIPSLILGTLSVLIIQFYIKENVEKENMNLLNLFHSNIQLVFNEIDSINLYIVSSATEFVDLQRILQKKLIELNSKDYLELNSLKKFIDSPTIAQPYVDSIYIYIENDKRHFLTSETGGVASLESFYDQEWFTHYKNSQSKQLTWTEKRTINRTTLSDKIVASDVISIYHKFVLNNNDQGLVVFNLSTDYLTGSLSDIFQKDGQNFYIVNNDYKTLFSNNKRLLDEEEMKQIYNTDSHIVSLKINDQPSVAFQQNADNYDFKIISTLPNSTLYELPFRLIKFTFIIILISIIISIIYTIYLTQKNYNDLNSIISIIQRAEKEEALPHLPTNINNLYTAIIHKILTNFMEHALTKVQLSEKRYKIEALGLSALQAQLNPHFLYNTLETINWKIFRLTEGPSDLTNMIENLADILRYSLQTENKLVSLKEEIQYTLSYIDIQKVRYDNQFFITWEIPKHFEKHPILKLTLQPFIENCLSHGIGNNSKDSPLLIKVKAIQIGNKLQLSIIDNGVGITKSRLEEINQLLTTQSEEQSAHIGLINTHRRIQLTYGDNYGITINSKYGFGTKVIIIIPT